MNAKARPRGMAKVKPTKPKIKVMGKPCKTRGKDSIATAGEKKTRKNATESHHSRKFVQNVAVPKRLTCGTAVNKELTALTSKTN